ncbi:hypothetical protein GF314_00870 [bacterium]|nr:hypothetical protein [bacterium]
MTRHLIRPKLTMTAAVVLVAGLAVTAAASNNPYLQPDDTWIAISGTVESVDRDAFRLDFGEGFVTVEMDDGDRDADGYKLVRGDKVTVQGAVDDDFHETTTIEAASVYVEKLGTSFHASAVDEEDDWVHMTDPVVVSETIVEGTVTEVGGDTFTLDGHARNIEVGVDEMPYDPLDDIGYQKIETGDRVRVTGDMELAFFDEHEFEAHSIVTLED